MIGIIEIFMTLYDDHLRNLNIILISSFFF